MENIFFKVKGTVYPRSPDQSHPAICYIKLAKLKGHTAQHRGGGI